MKIHWGAAAALLYLSFVAGMGYLVYRSMQEKVELVISNYYEHDKLFPEKFEQQLNALNLSEQVKVIPGNPVTIRFYSARPDKGTVKFYRPADSSLDKTLNLSADRNGIMLINTSDFKPGLWKVILQWKSGDKEFYTEERIFL
jgi:nitrogen fixation protein FixH